MHGIPSAKREMPKNKRNFWFLSPKSHPWKCTMERPWQLLKSSWCTVLITRCINWGACQESAKVWPWWWEPSFRIHSLRMKGAPCPGIWRCAVNALPRLKVSLSSCQIIFIILINCIVQLCNWNYIQLMPSRKIKVKKKKRINVLEYYHYIIAMFKICFSNYVNRNSIVRLGLQTKIFVWSYQYS